MAPYTPLTTGVGGVASAVAANMFDHSGYFRDFRGRSWSPKRKRTDGVTDQGEDRHSRYDLTQAYPPLTFPPPQNVDIASVKALLVDAAKEAAELEKADADGKLTQKQHCKVQTKTILTLFKLIESLVEKAVVPWAEAGGPRHTSGGDCGPPQEPAKVKALREALETADKTVIVFDANLGPASVANRTALGHNLTAGLRAAAIDAAADKPEEAVEGVRLASDALSCATKVEFLGQSSRKAKPVLTVDDDGNERQVERGFCTMPVRLEFEDRSGRLHFERTMRDKCGLKASMSLPLGLRVAQKHALAAVKRDYPGMICMVRPEVESLSFIAFVKNDGERKWTAVSDKLPIDPDCLSWTNGTAPANNAAGGSAGNGTGAGPMSS